MLGDSRSFSEAVSSLGLYDNLSETFAFSFLEAGNLSLPLVSVYGTVSPGGCDKTLSSLAFHGPRHPKYVGSISLLRQVKPKPVPQGKS